MTIPIEIMLRASERVFTDTIVHERDVTSWTAADAGAVLRKILQVINRLQNPGADDTGVALRGLNWIVSPYESGVVIALEIHSASAVAGPLPTDESSLTRLIEEATRRGADTTVH